MYLWQQFITELIKHTSWPIVTIFCIFFFQRELRGLLEEIKNFVSRIKSIKGVVLEQASPTDVREKEKEYPQSSRNKSFAFNILSKHILSFYYKNYHLEKNVKLSIGNNNFIFDAFYWKESSRIFIEIISYNKNYNLIDKIEKMRQIIKNYNNITNTTNYIDIIIYGPIPVNEKQKLNQLCYKDIVNLIYPTENEIKRMSK